MALTTTFHFDPWRAATKQRVETTLAQLLATPMASAHLQHAMQYSVAAGGKRIRPLLTIATGELFGARSDTTLVAAAIELLHTYSLIHDDLPAMDDDDLRRGQPSCHKAFDEATAILAGDALQALAFDILSTQGDFSDSQRLAMMACLAQAAGANGMVGGQTLDTLAENRQLDQQQLERIHHLKTGKLIEAALLMGAYAAGETSTATLTLLKQLGRVTGLAFQVQDDILDVIGNTAQLGKTSGADALLHKSTFPALLGLENSQAYASHLAQQALALLDGFDQRANALRALITLIVERQY